MYKEESFGWESFLVSIFLFLASWLSFREPVSTIVSLGIVYGIIAIIRGFFSIRFYRTFRRLFDLHPWPIILIGIIELLFGFYLVFNPEINIAIFPIMFAVWILMDSMRSILFAFRLRKYRKSWFWSSITLGVLGMIIGIFLATNLHIAFLSLASLVTIYFFLAGIMRLIDAFA